MIAYVTCLEEVERNNVLSRIQKQVIANESTKSSTSFNVSDLLKDPVLNSAFSETLRLQINGLSMKGVEQDTTLSVNGQTYTLEKGSIVFISMPGVHKDPEIYENPEQFQLKRFLYLHTTEKDDYDTEQSQKVFTKNGVVVRQPFFPWGGGHFMVCPQMRTCGLFVVYRSEICNWRGYSVCFDNS
jgi:cytochrome P450